MTDDWLTERPYRTADRETARVAAEGHIYRCSKTYAPNIGLSTTFRQWRATDSHCRFLHGYALQVKMTFLATTLDDRNWVLNFGGMKWVKAFLEDTFDHKTCIAIDDPSMAYFEMMHAEGLIQLRVLPDIGCESFARYIFERVSAWLSEQPHRHDVQLADVEVAEHTGNSAGYGMSGARGWGEL